MKQHPAWGVDVTSVGLRGAKLDLAANDTPRLVAWDVVDYTEEVEDLHSLARYGVISRGVAHFRSRHSLSRSRSWVSLRSEGAFNRTVVVPPVNDESLDRLLDYEAQQQIPYPLDEVFWDRRVLEINDGGEVRVSIYALRKSLVEDRLRKLAKMGLPADGFQLRALALQNFCSFEGLFDPGTVVVDVDYASLTILIHDGLETWFMTLPMGGVDYIERLRQTLGLDHKTAVKLASREQRAKDDEMVAACRAEIAQELVDEVASRTRFWFGTRPDVQPSSIVLLHSHRCVPQLQQALKRTLGLPVFVPRGFRRLEVDPDVVTVGIQEHFAGLAKAVGLALQGVGKAEVEAKVFPPTLERDLGQRRVGWVAAAILLLAWFGVGAWQAGKEAERLESLRLERTELMGEAVNAERAVSESALDTQLGAVRRLEIALGDLDGPAPLIEHLWTKLATQRAGAEAPYLVQFKWSPAGDTPPRIVLMAEEGRAGPDAAGRLLEDFARSLVTGGGIEAVQAGRSWSAGSPSHEPPAPGAGSPLLRRSYRHQEFSLLLRGGAE